MACKTLTGLIRLISKTHICEIGIGGKLTSRKENVLSGGMPLHNSNSPLVTEQLHHFLCEILLQASFRDLPYLKYRKKV